MSPWILDTSNSRLKRKHTKVFTQEIRKVIKKLKQLESGKDINFLCTTMVYYSNIHIFIGYKVIDEFNTLKNSR